MKQTEKRNEMKSIIRQQLMNIDIDIDIDIEYRVQG